MQTTKPEQQSHPDLLRRRLFRGVYGGVGVLMAVQAKTALGAACASPSAILSGNTSPRSGTGSTCSGGRSPGFWKVPQHAGNWSGAGAVFPIFTNPVLVCDSGMKTLTLDVISNQGTTLESVGLSGGAPSVTGIWAILAFPGSFSGGQLLRHLSAAWLNAGYFGSVGQQYPLTRPQIIQMWIATRSGGLYCPTSMTCGPSAGWSAQQVITYISGMYDVNASIDDPNLCTNK